MRGKILLVLSQVFELFAARSSVCVVDMVSDTAIICCTVGTFSLLVLMLLSWAGRLRTYSKSKELNRIDGDLGRKISI